MLIILKDKSSIQTEEMALEELKNVKLFKYVSVKTLKFVEAINKDANAIIYRNLQKRV